jgi:hypothetical protein
MRLVDEDDVNWTGPPLNRLQKRKGAALSPNLED